MRKSTKWLLLGVAIIFAAVLSYPYLGLDAGDSRIPVGNGLQYAVLVTHIFAATVALVIGPLQFMPKVRARRRVHRTLGRTYLIAVLFAALASVPVAMWSGHLLTQISLTIAAVLWLVAGGLAYRAARGRDFSAHRAWMMRNYALTFLAVTSRVLTPLLIISQLVLHWGGTGPAASRAAEMIPVGQTLGWIIDLIVVEILIRRTPAQRKSRRDRIATPEAV